MTLPPGPRLHPALQTLRWLRSPFSFMDECQARFGDAFTLRLAVLSKSAAFVVLSDPEVVKEVFALGSDEALGGPANFLLQPFLGTSSLFLLDGSEHLRHRRVMLPSFHGERMHSYGKAMLELAHDSIDRWPVGARFAAYEPMHDITLRTIIRTVFGIQEGLYFEELARLGTRGMNAGAWAGYLFSFSRFRWGGLTPWDRIMRVWERGAEILRNEIQRALEQGTADRNDVLAMLVQAHTTGSGRPLTESEIFDELMTLLIGGHETTAASLSWALRWILPNRALVARLREEIGTAGGDPMKISKLEMLDATIKETLRLQPVAPTVGRLLTQRTELGSLVLPKGTPISPAIYLVHRRPSLYPDPDRFYPERFLSFKPSPWQWLPFGGGLRRCIGAAFAVYEMKMVLAAVLSRIDAHVATDRVGLARRGVTIAPSGGPPIIVTRRQPRPQT